MTCCAPCALSAAALSLRRVAAIGTAPAQLARAGSPRAHAARCRADDHVVADRRPARPRLDDRHGRAVLHPQRRGFDRREARRRVQQALRGHDGFFGVHAVLAEAVARHHADAIANGEALDARRRAA